MNFIDEVKIYIKAGDGGRGCVSFRREKFVPRGGPDGGDGGHGGDVIFFVDPKVNTLVYFRHHHQFKAGPGSNGHGKNQTGRDGKELRIPVPEIGVTMANGRHVELDHLVRDGDVIAIFPVIGGG